MDETANPVTVEQRETIHIVGPMIGGLLKHAIAPCLEANPVSVITFFQSPNGVKRGNCRKRRESRAFVRRKFVYGTHQPDAPLCRKLIKTLILIVSHVPTSGRVAQPTIGGGELMSECRDLFGQALAAICRLFGICERRKLSPKSVQATKQVCLFGVRQHAGGRSSHVHVVPLLLPKCPTWPVKKMCFVRERAFTVIFRKKRHKVKCDKGLWRNKRHSGQGHRTRKLTQR
jgi:hypothetical protein